MHNVLGDLGAEVVKVEQPGVGDDTRGWGPPFAGGESAYYLCTNRNKKSLTVDLKSSRRHRVVCSSLGSADVVIENFRPGAMERLGLGEKELREINPRLIYASLSGFGADGPMATWPGYDLIVQAWGGLMSITGTAGAAPVKVGVAIIDLVAGLMLGKSIIAALFAREKIGVGQKHRHFVARGRSRRVDQRRQQLSGRRQRSRPLGQRPSEHRALSKLSNRRQLSGARRRQRSDLETSLPSARTRPSSPTIHVSPKMPSAWKIDKN